MTTRIEDPAELEQAFAIRHAVFVDEQHVDEREEYDEHEQEAWHYLTYDPSGRPVGTCRWRFTENGIKLERFAVLHAERGQGYGEKLVEACLRDVRRHPDGEGKTIYLHAQVQAVPFYKKFGFQERGELFYEAGIPHYLMVSE